VLEDLQRFRSRTTVIEPATAVIVGFAVLDADPLPGIAVLAVVLVGVQLVLRHVVRPYGRR
jgi:hypothetical protein